MIAYELRKIIRSHYPDFYKKLANVADHRKHKDYRSDELLTAAISMFIFKSKSRNALNNDLWHSGKFTSNFQKLFNSILPHLDAVQAFFEELPPEEMEKLKVGLISRLIEKKVFYPHKMFEHYMIAVDGTGVISCDWDRFGCGLKRVANNGLNQS